MSNKYIVVIEDPLNAFILNSEVDRIVALCSTKRPDLEFNELKELVNKANAIEKLKADLRGKDNEIEVLKSRINYLKQFEPIRKEELSTKG